MPNENSPLSPLVAHSYMEIHLFLQMTVCENCTAAPLQPLSHNLPSPAPSESAITVFTTCGHCQHPHEFLFEIPKDALPTKFDELTPINKTSQPSQLIDLAQWVTLDQMLYEDSSNESDAKLARRLAIKASLCLGEALKFFQDPDNDLPPVEAFFQESSRSRFMQNPQLYSRQRILALRAKRPVATPSEFSQHDSQK